MGEPTRIDEYAVAFELLLDREQVNTAIAATGLEGLPNLSVSGEVEVIGGDGVQELAGGDVSDHQ